VGKSSLFNRLIGKKQALVLDQPGVTRDVRTSRSHLGNVEIEWADLAGLEQTERDPLQRLAMDAALKYLEQADLAIFLVDARAGLVPGDEEIARLVRSRAKKVLLVLSKAEQDESHESLQSVRAEILNLGWGEALATSAEHNMGIDTLKEAIASALGLDPAIVYEKTETTRERKRSRVTRNEDRAELPQTPKGASVDYPISIGVYGRPNVGKSTLVNAILGESRMIVSPIAGTTVDTVDTNLERNNVYYRIVDTAGIRKRSKTEQGIEVLSVIQAMSSLPRVDVALFVIDGFEGVTEQDERIAGTLIEAGRATAIIVNKWDICLGKKEDYAEKLRQALPHLDFAPVLFVSAKKGKGVEELFDLIPVMLDERMRTVATAELNRVVKFCESKGGLKGAKLYYSVQISKNPPTIRIQTNNPNHIHYSFQRQLKNELRQRFGWMGSPLKLVFVDRTSRRVVTKSR
jgi:GTP-binding protein